MTIFFFNLSFVGFLLKKKKKKTKDLKDLMNYEFNNMTMLHKWKGNDSCGGKPLGFWQNFYVL